MYLKACLEIMIRKGMGFSSKQNLKIHVILITINLVYYVIEIESDWVLKNGGGGGGGQVPWPSLYIRECHLDPYTTVIFLFRM